MRVGSSKSPAAGSASLAAAEVLMLLLSCSAMVVSELLIEEQALSSSLNSRWPSFAGPSSLAWETKSLICGLDTKIIGSTCIVLVLHW